MPGRGRIEQLQLLAAVEDCGSLSGAAAALGMSQPSASRRVRELEDAVGVALVRRSAQNSRLTQAGLQLVETGRSLLRDWNEAVEAVRDDRASLAGHLRVVAPVAAGQGVLATIVARFLRRHPDITIDWALCDEAIDPIETGCDLWIRVGEVPTQDHVVCDLWQIDRAIAAAPGFQAPEDLQMLAKMPAVLVRTFVPESVRLVHDDGKIWQLRQSPILAVDNLYAARAALLEGVGYGVLPLWSIQRQLAAGSLTLPYPAWHPPSTLLCLVYAPSSARPRRLSMLIDFIKEELTRSNGLGMEYLRNTDASETVHLV